MSSAVGLACVATQGECGKTWFWCDTTAQVLTCKCGKVYAAGTSGDTSCTGTSKDNFIASLLILILF